LIALGAVLLSLAGAGSALADKYVALGDSYSSGTGTRTYFDSVVSAPSTPTPTCSASDGRTRS